MSGFLAVLKTDGSVPDLRLVKSLTAELNYRGPDRSGTWADQHVGMGHTLLYTTRDSEREIQPLVSAFDSLTLVADARIDDRERLLDDLRRAGVSAPSNATDPELILAAYKAWGVDAPMHLLGDFSFVLWDAKRRHLLLARDGFGMRRLYLAACPGGWVVSNEIRPLLLYPGVSQARNRQAMADFLVFGDIHLYDRQQTAFSAIRALPFGGKTLLTLAGDRQDSIFWQPESDLPVLRYRRASEYEEHFREVMREAVRDRIQGRRVLSLMSGGLDSSTATFFAAELTRAGKGADELVAFTTIAGQDDEEGRLARLLADHLKVQHRLVDVSDARPRPLAFWHSAPHPGSSIFPYTGAERAACALAPIHLNGYSADHVLCPEPSNLTRLAAQVGLPSALRSYGTLWRCYRTRPALGLRSFLAGRPPVVPGWAVPRFDVPEWLDPEFRQEMQVDQRCADLAMRPVDFGQGARPIGIHQLRTMWSWSMQEERWPTDFPPAETPDPFLDRRVLSFLWSLPAIPWFHRKHLLRSAMRGCLPDAILVRPKTSAGPRVPVEMGIDNTERLWDDLPEVAAMVRSPGRVVGCAEDPVRGWYPSLLGLWCRHTESAIRSGHREIDVFGQAVEFTSPRGSSKK